MAPTSTTPIGPTAAATKAAAQCKSPAATAKALAATFSANEADGLWLLSLVASKANVPWSMKYYGQVLEGAHPASDPQKRARANFENILESARRRLHNGATRPRDGGDPRQHSPHPRRARQNTQGGIRKTKRRPSNASTAGMTAKNSPAKTAAKAAWAKLVATLPAEAAPLELALLAGAMGVEKQWPCRVAALERVAGLCAAAPKQTAACLPTLVPELTPSLWDTKKEVKAAAKSAVTAAFGLSGNRDVEPVIPKLVSAASNPKEVEGTVHALAATTFVQSVDSPTLAVVVPLLSRALGERGPKATALKRQAALIICNMSKLVDDARDAAPFLPKLLPGLVKLADEIPDPEAREVCQKSVELMQRLETKIADLASANEVQVAVEKCLTSKLKGQDSEAVAYAVGVCCALAARRSFMSKDWARGCSFCASGEQASNAALEAARSLSVIEEVEEDEDDAEQLCDCTFTLAYGTKILLHNTQLKLKRGHNYGLLGGNDCGKTTLMRSISNGQLEGFPPADEVKTVFVEADIMGELSHLACIDYIFQDPRIQACGSTKEEVAAMMLKVGFSKKMMSDPVTTLSGGWRMKLALSRAMLQNADILLMDEPTNHLDVMNVKWVKDYIQSLTNVTCIMVSHDSGLLNDVCNHILEIADLKLACFKGNLAAFVKVRPEARAYFELKSNKLKFHFPKPGPIEGVKSKGKALIKVVNVSFKYPRNDVVTIEMATVQVSLSSRVACIGPNGAGKSTLIKCLTGEVQPTTGTVWQHPNARIGYIAQHAFHHVGRGAREFTKRPKVARETTRRLLSERRVASRAWHRNFDPFSHTDRAAHGEDAQRVHPLALRRRRGPGSYCEGYHADHGERVGSAEADY
jgi:elongation factor 3